MNNEQQLLQVSARLLQHLSVVPKGDERDGFIDRVHILLDERAVSMEALVNSNFTFDAANRTHQTLAELDRGINERLLHVMEAIKVDLKDLQNAKKNEQQYFNPYASVSTMDGRYYDKKK